MDLNQPIKDEHFGLAIGVSGDSVWVVVDGLTYIYKDGVWELQPNEEDNG